MLAVIVDVVANNSGYNHGQENSARIMDRFAGKNVIFSGEFGYGVEESLKAMAEAQPGDRAR